jgi:hypothetical protein
MSAHKKRRLLERKQRHKHLKKKPQQPDSGASETRIIRDPPGKVKMSEVLDEFVAPFKEPNATEKELRILYSLGAIAWNIALLPADEQEKAFREAHEKMPADGRELFRFFVEPLLERKRRHFADCRRGIVGFELMMLPSGPYLQVRSTLGGS